MAFAELKLRTALLFWNHEEIPNNVAMAREGQASTILRLPVLLSFGIISVFGLTGMLLYWRRVFRSPRLALLYFLVVIYWTATVLFYMLSRFRLPVVPLLCVFGGGAFQQIWRIGQGIQQRWPAGRRRALLLAGAVCAAVFVAYGAYPLYRFNLEDVAMRVARPHGVQLAIDCERVAYDRGPLNMGGWFAEQIPAQSTTFTKLFSIPDTMQGRLEKARLRMPFIAPQGGRLRVSIQSPGFEAGINEEFTLQLQSARGLQWRELDLPPVPVDEHRAELRITISGEGNAGLFFDVQRRYDRTLAATGAEGVKPLNAEAALELVWRNPECQ